LALPDYELCVDHWFIESVQKVCASELIFVQNTLFNSQVVYLCAFRLLNHFFITVTKSVQQSSQVTEWTLRPLAVPLAIAPRSTLSEVYDCKRSTNGYQL